MKVRFISLAFHLAVSDIRLHYRRTTLGPLWSSLTLLAQVLVIGVIFSRLFDEDMVSFLLFLASGLFLWVFMVNTITESTTSLTSAANLLKQVALPPYIHVYRVVLKNILILGHNMVLIVVLVALLGERVSPSTVFFVPGLFLLIANVVWVSVAVATVSARYRDVPALVTASLTLAFYVTPILWKPEQLVGSPIEALVRLNPIFHIIQVARAPILGNLPPWESFVVAGLVALAGLSFSSVLHRRVASNIPYWV